MAASANPENKHVSLNVEGVGPVELTYSERGTGQPFLLLHGGAGPISVVPWGELLARTKPARVITPTHPGFMGTPRPDALSNVASLARAYTAFLEKIGVDGVTVVGNSIGGWIAAEMAAEGSSRISGLVVVDGTGIDVPGHPMADVFPLSLEEIGRLSYHDPSKFKIDPSKIPPPVKSLMAGNMATLRIYSGAGADATLVGRLSNVKVPTLVAWGESDRIVDDEYGRAFARAIPGATFHMMSAAGHVPQVETPEQLVEVVWPFAAKHAARGTSARS